MLRAVTIWSQWILCTAGPSLLGNWLAWKARTYTYVCKIEVQTLLSPPRRALLTCTYKHACESSCIPQFTWTHADIDSCNVVRKGTRGLKQIGRNLSSLCVLSEHEPDVLDITCTGLFKLLTSKQRRFRIRPLLCAPISKI